VHLLLERVDVDLIAAGDDKIVDVHSHHEAAVSSTAEVDGVLGGAPLEPKPEQGLVEFGIPGSRSLPEPIKFLDEVEHLAFMAPEDEAGGCST
jgi:hypothetical protein